MVAGSSSDRMGRREAVVAGWVIDAVGTPRWGRAAVDAVGIPCWEIAAAHTVDADSVEPQHCRAP